MSPTHYKYLIIGGGMTADSAARGIRSMDSQGSIGLISTETDPPYNRPPLTKALWKNKKLETIFRQTEKQNVDLHLGRTAAELDPEHKVIRDDQGTEYSYQKLLLATGGSPNRLPFGGDGVIYLRKLADYRRLRTLTEAKSRFAVIGGGFIGSEIAAALRMNNKEVTIIFPDNAIGSRLFPASVAGFITDTFRQKGVCVLTGQTVTAIEQQGEEYLLKTSQGETIHADGVIAGLGIHLNVGLAQAAGIAVDNGILVGSDLQTSRPDIYAAGDVISFFNTSLGKRLRVEHEEHANQSGMLAGQAMAGQAVQYDFLPMAYSDLFEIGYESVGELNPTDETVEDWQEPFQKGVIYYLKEGRVRGVVLWNVWSKANAARELIAAPGPFKPDQLIGKIQ